MEVEQYSPSSFHLNKEEATLNSVAVRLFRFCLCFGLFVFCCDSHFLPAFALSSALPKAAGKSPFLDSIEAEGWAKEAITVLSTGARNVGLLWVMHPRSPIVWSFHPTPFRVEEIESQIFAALDSRVPWDSERGISCFWRLLEVEEAGCSEWSGFDLFLELAEEPGMMGESRRRVQSHGQWNAEQKK